MSKQPRYRMAAAQEKQRMTAWYDPDYDGDDLDVLAMPRLAPAYPGIRRTKD